MALDPVQALKAAGGMAQANNTKPVSKDETNATLNYDSFLKLLIAQMKNQDPTDPVDAGAQMSQLASFSQVEQSIKSNKHLETLIQETSMAQATAIIGKTVTSADGKITGIVSSVAINSDGSIATLVGGKQLNIETGITIASTPATPPTTP